MTLGSAGRRTALDCATPDTNAAAADVRAVEIETAAVKVKVEPLTLGLLTARDTATWPQAKSSNQPLSCCEATVLKTR